MITINRTVVFITPQAPYIAWANGHEEGGPQLTEADFDSTAYLIPEEYDEMSADGYLRDNFLLIFEGELESWTADRSLWPADLNFATFRQWFSVHVAAMVYDLVQGPVRKESI